MRSIRPLSSVLAVGLEDSTQPTHLTQRDRPNRIVDEGVHEVQD